MEWWTSFKIIWAAIALITLGGTAVLIWRVRGVLTWKRSLHAELNALRETAAYASPPQKAGICLIEASCREVLNTLSPEISELRDIPDLVRSLAACYHPDTDRPELQIAIGPFLRGLEKSLHQLDRTLHRPGFKKLRNMSIRNIRDSRAWYLRVSASPAYGWYFRNKKKIQGFSLLRLLVLPDPFSWLAYLSHHLTVMMLTKYLMTDIYLFFGKLTLEAFDAESIPFCEENEASLEETLEELESETDANDIPADPRIREIRNRLAGVSAVMASNPTFGDWKDAVCEAASIIAKKHFPESEYPLEEAALGPLLESTRSWADTLGKGEGVPVLHRFYRMRVGTLYRAKNLSESFLPKPLRKFILNVGKTYGWAKWPLKVYRMARKTSPWQIALELGWMASKKAFLAHVCGKSFDRACKELEEVYRRSGEIRKWRSK